MKNLLLKVDVLAGAHISDAIAEMIVMAGHLDLILQADFNGIQLIVSPGATYQSIWQDYERMRACRESRAAKGMK